MKKLLVLISFIALVGGFIWKWRSHHETPPVAGIWVKTSLVKETALPLETHVVGTLVAPSVEITAEIAGHIEKILFKDGERVKQGDTLIQLDDAVFSAQLQSAKAQLTYSENDYKRKVLLGKRGAIASQLIDQAEADLKEKRALVKEREVMVNKMKLLASFSGVVGKSNVNVGDYVTVGQRLVTLTDTQHLRIEYNIPEYFLSMVKIGQSVKLKASAYPEKIFSGKVAFISPTINSNNRSLALYANIDNEENLLAPGMFVNAIQSLGKEARALMVPARSLVPILDGEQIYRVVDGKAYSVTVTIGKRDQDEVQILQGIKTGDIIITDGQLKIKNGMAVNIKT